MLVHYLCSVAEDCARLPLARPSGGSAESFASESRRDGAFDHACGEDDSLECCTGAELWECVPDRTPLGSACRFMLRSGHGPLDRPVAVPRPRERGYNVHES